ncbi:MAG: hypothetical protein FP826_02235 [Sphingomonadales bacterium]|nr:hypothetical protein [Sphingomonadales bacterium]MBU3992572.1 hypothetical protein [Alphaproteobacteria bacterium]
MPQISETRAVEARASRNSFERWLRDSLSFPNMPPQPIPDLIAIHIGERFFARWNEGGEHG